MINEVLNLLTTRIILDLTLLQRKKYESLIIEILHMRDIINSLIEANGHQNTINCIWNTQQAFYFEESQQDPLNRLKVKQADVDFVYGFEYLGIPEKLAYTPLTNRCFLALTQALGQKLGVSIWSRWYW